MLKAIHFADINTNYNKVPQICVKRTPVISLLDLPTILKIMMSYLWGRFSLSGRPSEIVNTASARDETQQQGTPSARNVFSPGTNEHERLPLWFLPQQR